MYNKPRKPSAKAPRPEPRQVKKPVVAPKVAYVYRKDAFNKVKLA